MGFFNFGGEEAKRPNGKGKKGDRSLDDLLGQDSKRVGQGEEAAPLKPIGVTSDYSPVVAKESLNETLAREQGREFIKLSDFPLRDTKILRFIPIDVAKEYKCFPLREEPDGTLLVAISDPLNVHIEDGLAFAINRSVRTVIADEDAILEFIDRYYGIGQLTLESVLAEEKEVADEGVLTTNSNEHDLGNLEDVVNQPAVIKMVNLILMQTVRNRASDLHIEPFEGMMRIRFRVDGVLREIQSPPKTLQLGIISRLKVMANMNISEARRPQDGRIKLVVDGREVDMRVSTLPTVHGESMVMRVLDRSMMMIGIRQIGMNQEVLDRFVKICKRPNGIILVTGPTGCGKTTTLYAALNEINDPGEKVITTEEPVEFDVDGIVQVNINEGVGLTFARCLRAILRQDPDRILVGEIRDLETAQIAVQAALTGHLVLSTLHTNSAAATVTRLIDMGVEPFLLTSTLQAVIGQRLVRTICPSCKVEYRPKLEELHEFGFEPEDVADITFYEGAGCPDCANTGYKGRMGIFEMLEITDGIRELILQRASADEVQELAIREGLLTMRQDGWLKVCMGDTTFDEVARCTLADPKYDTKKQVQAVPVMAETAPQAPSPAAPSQPRLNEHTSPGEEARRPSPSPSPESFGDTGTLVR